MLQIGIHHGDVRRGAGEHPFDAGGGEAAAADAVDATHARILLRALTHYILGAIERIVDHDNGLPVLALQGLLESV